MEGGEGLSQKFSGAGRKLDDPLCTLVRNRGANGTDDTEVWNGTVPPLGMVLGAAQEPPVCSIMGPT